MRENTRNEQHQKASKSSPEIQMQLIYCEVIEKVICCQQLYIYNKTNLYCKCILTAAG